MVDAAYKGTSNDYFRSIVSIMNPYSYGATYATRTWETIAFG